MKFFRPLYKADMVRILRPSRPENLKFVPEKKHWLPDVPEVKAVFIEGPFKAAPKHIMTLEEKQHRRRSTRGQRARQQRMANAAR